MKVTREQPRYEHDHSPPFATEVKNERICTSVPPICLHGKHRGNVIFYLLMNLPPDQTSTLCKALQHKRLQKFWNLQFWICPSTK
jgi:hypothetical protein